jgi:oxygen-independent coproporphyrinogen-3 oxidase
MTRFVELILREADLWTGPGSPQLKPLTVFFGGGTPTLLPLEPMRHLIAELHKKFDFSACTEWTVEANPATVTAEYCHMLRDAGVNRLSFGAQSFNQAELSLLERHHHPDDVPRSVELARSAGFTRLNLDLIYAICGQTLDTWNDSLDSALALNTEHLSCYGLTYEPNTPLAVRKRLGRMTAVDEDVELAMASAAQTRLDRAGLNPYEISNYARPGAECRHNLLYWTGGDYIGLGPSAASHVQGYRWKNVGHLGQWEQSVADDQIPARDVEHLNLPRRAGELAMLSLRLTRGLIYQQFADKFSLDARSLFAAPISRLTQLGLLTSDSSGVRMTDRGWPVADALAGEFLLDEDSPV